MILLTLGLLREHVVPRAKKMDWFDHMLLWVIKVCLLFLFLTLPMAFAEEEPPEEFFMNCSGGKVQEIKQALKEHPEYVNARTESGEACLHLTGIYGHTKVTELLLSSGADPNIRTTWEQGLRMHPLSWNAYGGHVDNVKILLQYGADVNADFDSMGGDHKPITAMDIVIQLQEVEEGDDRFSQLYSLLRKHGGKTMTELQESTEL